MKMVLTTTEECKKMVLTTEEKREMHATVDVTAVQSLHA